jgi:hypothetical protein
MKTFAHFDSKGVVRALITVQGPDRITASPIPQQAHFVAEIEDLKLDPAKPDLAKIRQIANSLKVTPARASQPRRR